jgi:hypothetical protein
VGRSIGFVAALAFVIAVAVAGGLVLHSQSEDITKQSREITTQARTISGQTKDISRLEGNVASLIGAVQNPTDPLANYNQVCNQQMQNGTTGVDQLFYFPCTNQAQTTPQPGN